LPAPHLPFPDQCIYLYLPRYYETDAAITSHWRSKVHKRRCKQLKEPAYTIKESERAAGLGRAERKPPTMAAVIEDVVLVS
jgi:bud site selection protein 20